ncbi:MAG: helix-turn-helix domain-containing protein [Bacteroidota bacterium]
MSCKKRYIEKLNETEIEFLENGFKTGKSHTYRIRCKAILLSYEKWECNAIADFFDVHLVTVYNWLDRWQSGGVENMKDKPGRGRKPILDLSKENHVEMVNKAIENSPSNIKKALSKIEQELDVSMSKKTLTRFLKNLSADGNDIEKAL